MMKTGYTIEAIEITGAARERLLALEEGHFADLKAIEISKKKLGVTIVAFANAAGGDLYVGIGEIKILGVKISQWHGFKDMEVTCSPESGS